MRISIRKNQVFLGSRNIGWLTLLGNNTRAYISPRQRSKHYFRMYKGWGISEELLSILEEHDFDQIHIILSNKESLCVDVKLWRKEGIPYHKQGFEPQLILPEKWFMTNQLPLSEFTGLKK